MASTSVDVGWFTLFAFLCVLAYAAAISHKWRRNSVLYSPEDEMGAHLIATGMAMGFVVFSAEFGVMEFVVFGLGLLMAMFIYYVFAYSDENGKVE